MIRRDHWREDDAYRPAKCWSRMEVPDTVKQAWQETVDILADLVQVPAGLIMQLQGPEIRVLLSSNSDGNPYHPGDSKVFDNSGIYCETVVKTQNRLHVPNALQDEHWKNNPDVKLNMISYLGFPTSYPDKTPFGTISILDSKTNPYSPRVEKLMMKFKRMIEYDLELFFMNQALNDEHARFSDFIGEIQFLRGYVSVCQL